VADSNVVVLVGRLTRDVEVKQTKAGKDFGSLRLAYSTWNGTEEASNYIDATVWGKTATNLAPYLLKGTRVCIVGSLNFREWDGTKHSAHSVSVRDLQLLGGKDDAKAAPKAAAEGWNPDDDSKPLPF
jgi:single-strand DNA-binding protein